MLRSIYDMFDVLSPELESQLSSLPAAGDRIVERDAAVHSLGAAQETYEEAYEDFEEAVLKTQGKRAQRRCRQETGQNLHEEGAPIRVWIFKDCHDLCNIR